MGSNNKQDQEQILRHSHPVQLACMLTLDDPTVRVSNETVRDIPEKIDETTELRRRQMESAAGGRPRFVARPIPLTEIARFANFAGFARLIVDAPVRLVFAFNKIAMEYGLLFENRN